MSETSDQPPRNRSGLLSLIMLGILLASVLTAYLLSRSRLQYSERGAKIVQDVRAGLGQTWKGSLLRCYTVNRGGRAVGWSIEYRTSQDQRFDGVELLVSDNSAIWGHWELNSTATAGMYEAGFSGNPSLKISLGDHTTHVVQAIQSPPDEEVPENYLPIDTFPAAIGLIASGRGRAYFRMHEVSTQTVPDELGRPTHVLVASYVTVELQYKGRRQIQALGQSVDADVVELTIAGLGAESAKTYYLDQSGAILKMVQGDLEMNVARVQDVPGAAIQSLLDIVNAIGRRQQSQGHTPMQPPQIPSQQPRPQQPLQGSSAGLVKDWRPA